MSHWRTVLAAGLLGCASLAACRTPSHPSKASGGTPSSVALPVLASSGAGELRDAATPPADARADAPAMVEPALESDGSVRAVCAPGADSQRIWHVSAWHAGSPKIVALSFSPVSPTDDPKLAKPELCVLERQAEKLTKLAGGSVRVGETECSNMPPAPSDAPSFELDLAPYVLAPGNTALGVRLICQNSFPAGEGGQSRLYLFEQQGARLAQVLDEEIAWSNHDRVGRRDTDAKGVLVIQKSEHGGHFDLSITMSELTEPFEGAPSKKTETRKLVWKTDRYVRVGH
jgi:hypothetical protein